MFLFTDFRTFFGNSAHCGNHAVKITTQKEALLNLNMIYLIEIFVHILQHKCII